MTDDPRKPNQQGNDYGEKRGGYEPGNEGYTPSTTTESGELPQAPETGSGEKE